MISGHKIVAWFASVKPRLAALGVVGISLYSPAADLPGSKDHPLLKRFGGSEIVAYEVKRFDTYELQTSTFKKYEIDARRRTYAKPALTVEGSLTRIWYESAGETSSTELMRNYQNELKASNFQILYDSAKDPAAKSWVNFLSAFQGMEIKTNRAYYVFRAADEKGIRVTSAKLSRPEGDVYVHLTAVEWPKEDSTYKARKGAYIAVDIIEAKGMTQNMVVVSADEMSKAIIATGRVALYGILFDSNKADIKVESKAALDEIAKYLKANTSVKLHVVGHTDNVGGLDANLGLSKRRADAVVSALTGSYGIPASRLTANGVAYLAPVAVNTTEDGRAKNRRVELVPQ
jgi:outer membrane protein OmpA-like peptidoglycan-associated protein